MNSTTYKGKIVEKRITTTNSKKQKLYSPSKNFIYSPISIQEGQKQIIIQKLKEQIILLKKNQKQFQILQQHYHQLEAQYNSLFKQKKLNDQKFAHHHEIALKDIYQMKNHVDSMKAQFRQKKLQIQDLDADENVLKNQIDQKNVQTQKLKNQLKNAMTDNQQLSIQHQKLIQIHLKVKSQKQRKLQDYKKLQAQIQNIKSKTQNLKNYLIKLQKQQQVITNSITNYEQQNNKIDQDILQTEQDLLIIDSKIDESQFQIQGLQKNIAEKNSDSQKYKSQLLFHKKSAQNQVMKNNDLEKNIIQTQNILNVRKNQTKQGYRQVSALKEQSISLEKVNSQLEDDLEACRKHLQNLASLNNNLVDYLKKLSEQDEEVKFLIDRKLRVQKATQRFNQSQTQYKKISLNDNILSTYDLNLSPYSNRRTQFRQLTTKKNSLFSQCQ